ncbi:MAG: serine hydrolase [Bacteroidota bacterium]|nr:serine hydrolase [Bacteroidota bacterium]
MRQRLQQIILFMLVLFQGSALFAQTIDWNSLIEGWRKEYNVPGMSVGIIKDGKVILSAGYGVLEEGKSKKADQHTLYSIASNTKAFIAASIATLVDEGKITWDDPVRKWLPYFELYDPCVSEMMTVRDLLCHRSGLGTFSGDVIWYRSNYSAEEVVRHVSHLPAEFEFRNGYGYSNVMYIAAGEVIKAVTGKSWAEYVKATFFDPLQMTRTITSINQISSTSNVATPHKPEGEINNPIDWVNWDNMGAPGGIISSVDDMLKWMNLQLQRGIIDKDTFFLPSSQITMWTPHANFPVSARTHNVFGRNFAGYGLGWGLNDFQGHFVASHTGGYDGMYSSVYLLPYDNIGIVVLTNTMNSIGPMLSFEIADKLLGLPQKDWKVRGLNQDVAGIADRAQRIKEITDSHIEGTHPTMTYLQISGVYNDPLYGDIRIEKSDSDLYLDFLPAPELKAKLTHWHHDTYEIQWLKEQAWFGFGTVQILKDNNGKANKLLFDIPNDDIFFEEINAVRSTP